MRFALRLRSYGNVKTETNNIWQRAKNIKIGDRIRIIHLEGEDDRYDGREGVVEMIDSLGQLHGTWGGLAVIPEADSWVRIG